jgi:polyhydroxyalkanoate synthesis repressor PhaR
MVDNAGALQQRPRRREARLAETSPDAEGPPTAAPPETPTGADTRIVIKKYANRRLYNTGSSSYVTLEHLSDMVKAGVDFVVYDARTGEDITRQVLTQIIFEAENSGQNLLPIQFLRQLIRMYGDQVQAFVPSYLEMSLDAFAHQQDALREQFGGALAAPGFAAAPFVGGDAYRLFQDQIGKNMALFDKAMKMFSYPRPVDAPGAAATPAPSTADPKDETLAEMKARLDEMQRQIARLAGR